MNSEWSADGADECDNERYISLSRECFLVTHTRSHDHTQLGCITPTDCRVKGVS